MRFFDEKDVIRLLRSEVKRAGSQAAWAKKAGIQRTWINKILKGRTAPTKKVISALKLRTVYVRKKRLPYLK
jgi:DNA-binding phage protein